MKAFILFLDFSMSRNVMWHTTYLHLHYDVTYLKIHRLLYTILVACCSRMILYSEEFLKTTNTSAAMTHFSLRQWHPNLWTRWSEALGNCNQRATATIWRKERFPVGFLLNASIFILFWLNCVHHHGPLNTAGWQIAHPAHCCVCSKFHFFQSQWQCPVTRSCFIVILRWSCGNRRISRRQRWAEKIHHCNDEPLPFLFTSKTSLPLQELEGLLTWILEHKILPLRKSIILLNYYK